MKGNVLSEGWVCGRRDWGSGLASGLTCGWGDAIPCSCQSSVRMMGLNLSDADSVWCLPEQRYNFCDMSFVCNAPSPQC